MSATGATLTHLTKPRPNGPYIEQLIEAVSVSSGTIDAGKLVLLNNSGLLDSSMSGGGTGQQVLVRQAQQEAQGQQVI
jgi:hypothetical protein